MAATSNGMDVPRRDFDPSIHHNVRGSDDNMIATLANSFVDGDTTSTCWDEAATPATYLKAGQHGRRFPCRAWRYGPSPSTSRSQWCMYLSPSPQKPRPGGGATAARERGHRCRPTHACLLFGLMLQRGRTRLRRMWHAPTCPPEEREVHFSYVTSNKIYYLLKSIKNINFIPSITIKNNM